MQAGSRNSVSLWLLLLSVLFLLAGLAAWLNPARQNLGIPTQTNAKDSTGFSRGLIEEGDRLLAAGDAQAAIQAWEAALQAGAPAGILLPKIADAYHQLGSLQEYDRILKMLASSEPENATWLYQRGLVLAIQQPGVAHDYLEKAARFDPTLSSNVRNIDRGLLLASQSEDRSYQLATIGQALAAVGDWKLAEAAFLQAVQSRADYAEAWTFLGEARRKNGKDGFPELVKAVQLDPKSIAANSLLGLYWQEAGRLDLALTYLSAAAQQDPGNPALQISVGQVLAQQGNFPASLLHYQRAAEMRPSEPTLWRALADFTIEYGIQVKEVGLPASRTAVLLNPKDPVSLDTMAQVYIRMGHPEIAERFIKRALGVDPLFAPAHLHMGLVYLLEGEAGKGKEQLLLAERLAPDGDPIQDQARRLLSNQSN